jgi:hypothetical protein
MNIVRNYVFLVTLTALFFCSCTTITKKENLTALDKVPQWKNNLKSLVISGNMASSYHGQNFNGSCKLIILGEDSLSLTLTGPFGILVGKLYANPYYFIYYDIFNNEVLEGKPTAKNLKQAAMLPLSFEDIVHLLKCESPAEPGQYEIQKNPEGVEGVLFKNFSNTDYVEYLLYSSPKDMITQYQRKLRDGKLILNLLYKDYDNVDGFELAKNLVFNFPEIDGNLTFEANSIEVNKNQNMTLRFQIPEGVKKYVLD